MCSYAGIWLVCVCQRNMTIHVVVTAKHDHSVFILTTHVHLCVCQGFSVSVFQCFGVSVFRCFSVSEFQCFSVSVFWNSAHFASTMSYMNVRWSPCRAHKFHTPRRVGGWCIVLWQWCDKSCIDTSQEFRMHDNFRFQGAWWLTHNDQWWNGCHWPLNLRHW